MIYVAIILLAIACFYIGIILGIKDCKRRFCIPKGVETLAEYQLYLKELEVEFQ